MVVQRTSFLSNWRGIDVLNTAKFHVQFCRDGCIPFGCTVGQFHCYYNIPKWNVAFEAVTISAIHNDCFLRPARHPGSSFTGHCDCHVDGCEEGQGDELC